MGQHKLRILKETIKGRGWQSPKYKNQFLKPQWTLASTCLCVYLLWNSSKFCAMSIVNHWIMSGHLLFPSSVKSLYQLRHTSDLHWLPTWGILIVSCPPVAILSELFSGQQLFSWWSYLLLSWIIIYIFVLSFDFFTSRIIPSTWKLMECKWLCFIFSFLASFCPFPLPHNHWACHSALDQEILITHLLFCKVGPSGTSQLHWDRTISAPPKKHDYKGKGKRRGNMFN